MTINLAQFVNDDHARVEPVLSNLAFILFLRSELNKEILGHWNDYTCAIRESAYR